MRTAVIMATEGYGDDRSALSIRLVIDDSALKTGEDIVNAVRKAVRYYVKRTLEGKANFDYNGKCFNWGDFYDNVPNSICQKFGFRKEDDDPFVVLEKDLGEQLV